MRRALLAMAALGCLLPGGCARRPAREPAPAAPAAPTSTRMRSPSVRVADPAGKWTFSARAESMSATSQQGPYTLSGATGSYQPSGQPPVHMRANHIVVDEGAQRVTLQGGVEIRTPAVVMRGERVSYDLRTGKVRASGPTKWTFTGSPLGAGG